MSLQSIVNWNTCKFFLQPATGRRQSNQLSVNHESILFYCNISHIIFSPTSEFERGVDCQETEWNRTWLQRMHLVFYYDSQKVEGRSTFLFPLRYNRSHSIILATCFHTKHNNWLINLQKNSTSRTIYNKQRNTFTEKSGDTAWRTMTLTSAAPSTLHKSHCSWTWKGMQAKARFQPSQTNDQEYEPPNRHKHTQECIKRTETKQSRETQATDSHPQIRTFPSYYWSNCLSKLLMLNYAPVR